MKGAHPPRGRSPALTPTMRTAPSAYSFPRWRTEPNALTRDLVARAIVNVEFAGWNMPVMNSLGGKLRASIDP
jgi:hypothetical protein